MNYDQFYEAVLGLIRAGLRIHAMKLVRDYMGHSLKDAKDVVEHIEAQFETCSLTGGIVNRFRERSISSDRFSTEVDLYPSGPWAYIDDPIIYRYASVCCLN